MSIVSVDPDTSHHSNDAVLVRMDEARRAQVGPQLWAGAQSAAECIVQSAAWVGNDACPRCFPTRGGHGRGPRLAPGLLRARG